MRSLFLVNPHFHVLWYIDFAGVTFSAKLIPYFQYNKHFFSWHFHARQQN